MSDQRSVMHYDWEAEGRRLFGEDIQCWKFVCPACGHIASVSDWKAAGAPAGAVPFSCIGRWLPGEPRDAFTGKGPGPCNYAGGGLFGLNPVRVEYKGSDPIDAFEFAPPEVKETE